MPGGLFKALHFAVAIFAYGLCSPSLWNISGPFGGVAEASELRVCTGAKRRIKVVRQKLADLEFQARRDSFTHPNKFRRVLRNIEKQARKLQTEQLNIALFCPEIRNDISTDTLAADQSVNVLTNPGFETGTQGWRVPITSRIAALPVHSGLSALEVRTSPNKAQEVFQDFSGTGGRVYNISIWLSNPSAAPHSISVKWFNAVVSQRSSGNRQLIGISSLVRNALHSTPQWAVYDGRIAVPPGAIQGRLDLLVARTDLSGIVYLDDASVFLEVPPTPTPTATNTHTSTSLPTPLIPTPSRTATSTVSFTPTNTSTRTVTPTPTSTFPTTSTPTAAQTPTPTPTSISSGVAYTPPLPVNFYVCACEPGADPNCVAGSDSNNGLSPQTPWLTYERARTQFAALQAGQAIGFCRGGALSVSGPSIKWINSRCLSGSLCTVADYIPPWASGDENRPIIESTGAGVFDFSEGGSDGSEEQGYRVRSLELRGGLAGNGVYIADDVDDVTLENLVVNGFDIGVHVNQRSGISPGPEEDGISNRITLRDSFIINNGKHGWLGGASDSVIENNRFENNAFARDPGRGHNVSWTSSQGATDNSRISSNVLYKNAIFSDMCQAVSLVSHGVHSNLTIEDNLVYEDVGHAAGTCWGITIDTANPITEQFDNLVIRRNRIVDVAGVGIGCTSCTNSIIENNVIIHSQASSIRAIAVPNRARGVEDVVTTNVVVRNNSILIGSSGTGITVETEGNGHVVVSNAIRYTGTNQAFNCFNLPLAPASYAAVDYNLCFFSSVDAEWEEGSTDNLSSTSALLEWQNASPFDDNSLFIDPLFSQDLLPGSSQVVGNGHTSLSAPDDINRSLRDSNPDIGAHELGT